MADSDPDVVRISARLSRDEIEFLDRLALDARFSGGRALSRAAIFRAALRAVREAGVDVTGVQSADELVERIIGRGRAPGQ